MHNLQYPTKYTNMWMKLKRLPTGNKDVCRWTQQGNRRLVWPGCEIEKESDVFERPMSQRQQKMTVILYFTSGTTGHPKMAAHDFTYPLGHIITAIHWHRSKRVSTLQLRKQDGQAVWERCTVNGLEKVRFLYMIWKNSYQPKSFQ